MDLKTRREGKLQGTRSRQGETTTPYEILQTLESETLAELGGHRLTSDISS